jgi:hypothetical protein
VRTDAELSRIATHITLMIQVIKSDNERTLATYVRLSAVAGDYQAFPFIPLGRDFRFRNKLPEESVVERASTSTSSRFGFRLSAEEDKAW